MDQVVSVSIPGEVTVALERGLEITGRTVFPNGEGHAGAAVEVRPPLSERVIARAQADPQGHFRVAGLPALFVRVEITAPTVRATSLVVPAGADLGDVVMEESIAHVRFRVRSADGGDLSPGYLTVVSPNHEAHRDPIRLWEATRSVGPMREAHSAWLQITEPASVERLELHVDGFLDWRSALLPLRDATEATEFEVVLQPDPAAVALDVHFEDEAGAPVAVGPQSSLLQVTGSSGVIRRRILPAGTQGLRLTGLPPERVTLDVHGDAYAGRTVLDPAAAGETVCVVLHATGGLDISFPRAPGTGVAFVIRQLLASGLADPVTALEIGIDGQQSRAFSGEVLPEGRFLTDAFAALPDANGTARRRIEGLPPGQYLLHATESGRTHPVEVTAGQVTEAVFTGN